MVSKADTRALLVSGGVVPIIRVDSADTALRIADAILAGGIACLEVTLTTPGALQVIEEVARRHGRGFAIGAGTVLDPESARLAINAGASFIVSPNTRRKTLELCLRYGIISCPGALTPTEVVTAWEQGGDLIKVFPCGNLGGASYIKALKAPLPQIDLVPTGGVELDNVGSFIKAGATAVAVGASLMRQEAIAAGDWAAIAALAGQFVAAVAAAREG
ncbi:MAG: bifunctional 4-hydroxy-2-oxoglutarate aldolase/2-dehydro-3-deoxy-phosphogluconate aldolase [Fimbriimonadaceae bacterium]|nr:bifunctional 4-hydroxy-2-oxoglutarate aldolase/2-dehydro-3-deoxy-phosphogluconate aldolase [Fimbriimonadaceae bacterium]